MAKEVKTRLGLKLEVDFDFERAVSIRTSGRVKLELYTCNEVIDQIDAYESLADFKGAVESVVLYNIKTYTEETRADFEDYLLEDLLGIVGVRDRDCWKIANVEIYDVSVEPISRSLTTGVEVMEHVFRDAGFVYTYKTKTRRDLDNKIKMYELLTLFVESVIKRAPAGLKAPELEALMKKEAAMLGFNLELMAILLAGPSQEESS